VPMDLQAHTEAVVSKGPVLLNPRGGLNLSVGWGFVVNPDFISPIGEWENSLCLWVALALSLMPMRI